MAENTIEVEIGSVKVKVTGEDDWPQVHLEQALKTLKRYVGDRLEGGPDAEPPAPSVAELLASSRARTFGEKAGVVAYWLQTYDGRSRWRSGEIVKALEDAGEAVPTNITDALNQKAKKGLFEANDRMWRLTGEGVGWVKYSLLAEGTEG